MVREVGDDEGDEMEREANRFAAELLMPTAVCAARADEFRKVYGMCPLQPFAYRLAAELLVSSEAMRYRLRELGVCDE
jgi:Zn-dependent peptidase ImmA (M78 family)